MQIPEVGWLELKYSSSPLRFFPTEGKTHHHTTPIDVTLGKNFPSSIQIQSKPVHQFPFHYLPVHSKQTPQGNVQLGPFVAILTSDSRMPFAGNHRNFADLIQMGKRMGVTVYVLTPKGILNGKPYVKGYLLEHAMPTPSFRKEILPLPNVIYNRVPYRSEERSYPIVHAIEYFNQKNIPIFNPGFFNKWSLFRALSPTECRSNLPATEKFAAYTSFRQMLIKHNELILKPVEGKAGIGMIKVEGKGPFILYYQTKTLKQRIVLPRLEQVYQQIKKRVGEQNYLIQQGISLATYQGRPFDIRMLIQKDRTAKWNVSGIGVRIAGQTAISTHVPMGGRIENFQRVLSATFPSKKNYLQHKLTQLGIKFAKEIEQQTRARHGEMSMDIGIDKQGKLWFFEANAKPQKFDEPAIRKTSLQRILEYALYLSDFQPYRKVKKA
jgi:hypothetical protein